jgi:hypothetical protein
MEIQCDCGKFRAELTQFPKNTPGRLICYCNDCQAFLHYLKRPDLLNENAGSEIIPAYPADIKIIEGKDFVKCVRLHSKGMYRFFSSCCLTPIANTDPTRPWAGIHRRMYLSKGAARLDRELGPVKSSIMGKHAKGSLPAGIPQTFDFKGMITVIPFIIKGKILGKAKHSPFFENGEAIVVPLVLTEEERSRVEF